MDALDDVIDRAIDYTDRMLDVMPSYRGAAVEGLAKLREALARKYPDDQALERLDAYLNSLKAGGLFLAP